MQTFSKEWCDKSDKFIYEGSATMIYLIFNAKRFGYGWKKTYNDLYPKLCKNGKKLVDETLPKIKKVTQKELNDRECIFCHKKKCSHGDKWKEEIGFI